LPITKDAVIGPHFVQNLALIYAWTGEKYLALKQLRDVTKVPGYLSYSDLHLHPRWDPLRGDPRFEQIVGSLAPGGATESAGHESRPALRRSDSPR
jgi:hypothetical protein